MRKSRFNESQRQAIVSSHLKGKPTTKVILQMTFVVGLLRTELPNPSCL
jgi:hypothetical protein